MWRQRYHPRCSVLTGLSHDGCFEAAVWVGGVGSWISGEGGCQTAGSEVQGCRSSPWRQQGPGRGLPSRSGREGGELAGAPALGIRNSSAVGSRSWLWNASPPYPGCGRGKGNCTPGSNAKTKPRTCRLQKITGNSRSYWETEFFTEQKERTYERK